MPKQTKKSKPKQSKQKTLSFYQAVGRRKEATARVRFYPVNAGNIEIGDLKIKKGKMVVNGKSIEEYFPGQIAKAAYLEPFRTTNTVDRFTVSAKIQGSGKSGQLGALIHGIARVLEKVDREKFRPILKKKGFLTRDARVKERRKAGLAQSARAKKQSPKR